MNYVDYAESGAQNRNNPKDILSLNAEGKTDTYCTYFRFDESFRDYVLKNHTVKDYKGDYIATFLPFDIDNDNLDKAKHNAIKIVECLQLRYGLLNNDIDIYFTGAKGFHIEVSAVVLGGFTPSQDLARIFKELALEISAGYEIDPVIYESMRLWRLPNTINSKTGLYKIQLSIQELFTLTIEQIKDLAKNKREITTLLPKQNQTLTDLYWQIKMSLKDKPQFQQIDQRKIYPNQEKYCIYNMLNNGVVAGERNNAILRMAVYLNSKFSPDVVSGMLKQWNIKFNMKIEDTEIDRTVESSLKGYDYGCTDGLLKKYCSDKCTYPIKKQSKYTVKSMEDLEREYIEYIKDIHNIKIDLSKWLPKFSKVSRGLTAGEVVIVIAGSGVGKTAFLQNLLWNMPVPTVFFSYELPEILTYERFYQIANKCTGEVVEAHYKLETPKSDNLKKSFCDLSLLFDSDINIDDIPAIVANIETQRQIKIKIVAIDYLGFVKGGQGSRYERVSYIAEKLKDTAKKTNSVVICLAQVSRQEGAKGNEDLEITSGKDLGSIENTGDLVIGMYRPNKKSQKEEDNIIRIKILKNRKGKDNIAIDCYFDKDSLRINEMDYGQELSRAKEVFGGTFVERSME